MRKKIRYVILGLVLIVMCGVCIYGFTYAKYVYNKAQDYYLSSRKFYFESDYLGTESITNVNNLWDLGSIQFNVRNNDNDALITNYNITYTVECTIEGDASNYLSCNINDPNNGTLSSTLGCTNNTNDLVDVSGYDEATCNNSNYNWENQITTNDIYFDIEKTDNTYNLEDVTVNIRVTSTSPYEKVLLGKFVLHKKETDEVNVTSNYEDYDNYGRLNIYNTSEVNKCIQVSWNADNLKIDSINQEFSSYLVDANNYINSIIIPIETKRSKSYVFYKNGGIYDNTSFTISDSDDC